MKLSGIVFVVAAVGFLLANAAFVVDERKQAIVLQFGEYIHTHEQPGLYFKWPFVQNVVYYPRQALAIDHRPSGEITLLDQKRLVVDSYGYYRIVDPLEFYKTLGTIMIAEDRIASRIESVMRDVLGRFTLDDVLSEKRLAILDEIQAGADSALRPLGVEMLDVRIRRADLPAQNSESIVKLMNSERDREAKELRAGGEKVAQEIKSKADKDRTILLAQAEAEAQRIRGEGDARATEIYAKSYGADAGFFAFYRSLDAYRVALRGENTTFVIPPEGEFFRFLDSSNR